MIGNKYSEHLQIYTDGSKNPENGNTACAFVVPELNHTEMYKLDTNLTVFTSELIAIEKALKWNLTQNITNQTAILTDSLSSIQAINSGKSKTRPDKIHAIKTLILKPKRGRIQTYKLRMGAISYRNSGQLTSRQGSIRRSHARLNR